MGLFAGKPQQRQRDTYARGRPYLSGETVTPGRFRCAACEFEYAVPPGRITNLPVCPRCQHEHWRA